MGKKQKEVGRSRRKWEGAEGSGKELKEEGRS